MKVSWQITAVRQDDYAKAHPVVVEQEKPASERGFYQNPELFGQPKEKQTEWARRPKAMQQMKLQQEARKVRIGTEQVQRRRLAPRPTRKRGQSQVGFVRPGSPTVTPNRNSGLRASAANTKAILRGGSRVSKSAHPRRPKMTVVAKTE